MEAKFLINMKLTTPVSDAICKVGISYNDKIMMLGSCFADNIGRQLDNFGFDVCVNPFGTLYNPLSILQTVRMLLGDKMFDQEDCIEIGAGDERICSFNHHTSFARATREEFIANANEALCEAREFFKETDKVIITLGTSWCFRHIERDIVVSNCLKRNPAEFRREFISADKTGETLVEIMRLCNSTPGVKAKKFIFTVSPIRHFKDGAHGNQLSKSALLLGVYAATKAQECGACHSTDLTYIADYFPAYEIMMDELRDYRFYAEDMCHLSQQAVNYIRERFLSWALPASEHGRLEINISAYLQRSHIVKA